MPYAKAGSNVQVAELVTTVGEADNAGAEAFYAGIYQEAR